MQQIINSMLDDDTYKFTMQNAVSKLYPNAYAKYQFINRGKTPFPDGFGDLLKEQIKYLENIKLTKPEKEFLQNNAYFFDPVYIDLLYGYRYNPDEVSIAQENNILYISIEGLWYRTILWEVKLMALISELYFRTKGDYNYSDIGSKGLSYINTKEKAILLQNNNCLFADFGTRRRYSYENHFDVVQNLKNFGKSNFIGTSNIHLAMVNNVKFIGTQAHEWYSGIAALNGYHQANSIALGRWVDVYKGSLGIALTDTFTTDDFLKCFDTFYAKLYDGCRHDSGEPIEFGEKIISHYKKLKIDPLSKTIVFSDGLNSEEAVKIQKHFNNRIKVSFGIGTNFTNDVGHKPLNIVIKMTSCKNDKNSEWIHAIKLSDSVGKNTGDPDTIRIAKEVIWSKK